MVSFFLMPSIRIKMSSSLHVTFGVRTDDDVADDDDAGMDDGCWAGERRRQEERHRRILTR